MEPLSTFEEDEEENQTEVGVPPQPEEEEGYLFQIDEEGEEWEPPVQEPVVQEPAVEEEVVPTPPAEEEPLYQINEEGEDWEPPASPTPDAQEDLYQIEEDGEDWDPDLGTVSAQTSFVPPMEEGKEYLVADDIRNNPERMAIVRDYMVMRSGDQYRTMDDAEVYDDYVNAMRYVSSNELSMLYDANLIFREDKGDNKTKMAKAYELYGQLGNFYQTDGFLGGADALKDYAVGVLTSPSTYLGLGVGKLVSQGVMQGGKKAAVTAVISAARNQAAAEFAGQQVAKSVIKQRAQAIAQEGIKSVVRRTVGKEVAAMAAAEGTVSMGVDLLMQDHQMNVGVRDEYSFLQAGLVGSLGAASALIPGALAIKSGKLPTAEARALRAEIGSQLSIEAKQAGQQLNVKGVTTQARKLRGKLFAWDKAVKEGKQADLGEFGRSQKMISGVFGFQEDTMGIVPKMMQDAGIFLDPDERAVQQMLTFVDRLPAADRAVLDDVFEKEFGKGLTLTTMTDELSATISTMGQTMQSLQAAAQRLSEKVTRTAIANEKAAASKALKEADKVRAGDVLHYVQSVWKRALVSHPATTAVNVMGWGQATAARQMAQMFSGAYYGVTGWAAKMVSPFSAKAKTLADKNLKEAGAIFKSRAYVLGNMLHPNATYDEFSFLLNGYDEVVERAGKADRTFHRNLIPQKYKSQLDRAGVSQSKAGGPIKLQNSTNKVVRGVEKTVSAAQRASMVGLQDSLTKAQSFMEAINTEVLRTTGKSYDELVATQGYHAIPDEAWERATAAALRDTMSADYTKGQGLVPGMAKVVEQVSNNTVLGFVLPFGRFMNNAMAFAYQYSPVGLARLMGKHPHETTADIISQAAVGSFALGVAWAREREKSDRGIPWYVEEGADGVQYDYTNLAPGSAYSLMGRIMHHFIDKGENPVDEDVLRDLLNQLGSVAVLNTMNKSADGLGDKLLSMFNRLSGDNVDDKTLIEATLGGVASGFAGVFAGFTRPLEVVSVSAAQAFWPEEAHAIDRNSLEGWDKTISEATRYVDGFFAPLMSDEQRPVRYEAVNPAGHKDVNPIARVMGQRNNAPQTATERMFAEAMFPEWRGNQKSTNPQLDAIVNQRIFDTLEAKAATLIDREVWDKANIATKRKLVNDLLKQSRQEVIDWVTADPTSNASLSKMRDTYNRQPEDLRRRAQETFNIKKDVKDMSPREIMELNEYIDYLKEMDKRLIE